MKYILTLFATVVVTTQLIAQTNNADLVKEWERAKAYSKEYLDSMPAASYGLKPTKDMRSFAGQFLHLSDAIYGFVAAATDEKAPGGFGELEKSNDENKASVIAKVMAAYDSAIAAIKKYPAARLTETVKLFGRFDLTRGQALDKCFEHQTHHRGQATVYLRLAGVKPPAEKLF